VRPVIVALAWLIAWPTAAGAAPPARPPIRGSTVAEVRDGRGRVTPAWERTPATGFRCAR